MDVVDTWPVVEVFRCMVGKANWNQGVEGAFMSHSCKGNGLVSPKQLVRRVLVTLCKLLRIR